MKISNIELYSDHAEEKARFCFKPTSPFEKYMIRGITGLDASELVPRFYSFGKKPGTVTAPVRKKFYEVAMKPREVSIRVALNPNFENNESYSDIRDDLYKMVSATRTGEVVLYFNHGAAAVAQLDGFITKFEVGYFNALPEVQITVRCDNPMLRGVVPIVYDLNDDRYPDPVITDDFLKVPDSLSTAPHGVLIQLEYNGYSLSHGPLRIRDTVASGEADWQFGIKVTTDGGAEFSAGDVLFVSSIAGRKNVYVEQGPPDTGVTTFLVDKLESNSVWPIIFPGENAIYINHAGIGICDVTRVEYYPLYWGV